MAAPFGQVKKRWRITPPADAESLAAIAASTGCSHTAAQLLFNRGITTPDEAAKFLRPSLDHLSDPFLLPDAESAAERIKQALQNREKIWIHGDYDGDGVTSAALWMRLLEKLGANVQVHVPHRKRDGYDMRSKFVAEAKTAGVTLIITSDCGIQRCDEVDEAREAGIDVIITDHHEPGEQIPRAVAVVNPHRKDSGYPFRSLAGVGVAFRMGEALVRHLGLPVNAYRRAFIDLAAVGTVTDMVPLTSENRILVKYGLESFNVTKKLGLLALMRSAGLRPGQITARDVGFVIGPRLNAAGRVGDSDLSLQLLLTRDADQADSLAAILEQANVERRLEQDRVLLEAISQVAELDMEGTSCLVVHGSGWHSGVIGLVANKLVERYHRPAILIAADETTGTGRGSARSIGAFHMLDAITESGRLLIEFGGHSHAAGLSLDLANLEEFRTEMNQFAAANLSREDFVPAIDVDMEIDQSLVNHGLMRELAAFDPWGMGNEEPLFVSRGVGITEVRRIGKEQQHLKMAVGGDSSQRVDALAWGNGDLADHIHAGDSLSMCYLPRLNHYNGRITVQYMIQDLRSSDPEDI